MIVDLEKTVDKRQFITDKVNSVTLTSKGLWAVSFSSSSHVFNYNPSRLLVLDQPETVDIQEKGVYIKNRHVDHIAKLIRFSDGRHTYYHIIYSNGYYENLDGREVYVTRTRIDKNGGSTWEYLNKLAEETGLTTDDDESILSKQYALVDLKRDTVPLAQYLGDRNRLCRHRQPLHIYYPFGCNASQKAAVEAALTHQVSVIQGPPGTGKTQTILNILANLLLADKTVLVVSNNNSAVENVAEKLAKENLGFIVAHLGSAKNKAAFIDNQPEYPDFSGWKLDNAATVSTQADEALQSVTQDFEDQLQQAALQAEYDALLKESAYNDMQMPDQPEHTWLESLKSSGLMKLLNRYQTSIENKKQPSFWTRLKWSFTFGFKVFSFLDDKPSKIQGRLETAYYAARRKELEKELHAIASRLKGNDMQQNLNALRTSSLQLLKDYIARRYAKHNRKKFTRQEIKHSEFLEEYPVILSTTYASKSNIHQGMVFDYVIMDEASQVDIKTGALALSCATNAVIVGDDKQLPNVVSREEALALEAIQTTYHIDDRYNAVTHSFLQSCLEIFTEAPVTLLREHYRCHPKIIEFCNRRFYDGELLSMTTDHDEPHVLQVVTTVPGNHARGHFNQREIDTILQEVLPDFPADEDIGIITPYRTQATAINQALGKEIASTVHKFQGRECDTIIMSLVDNTPTEFSDDANLLNVAISRAKKHLCIVTNGNEMDRQTNLAQLIGYIRYNNFEVRESALHSVFDLLYKSYTAERLAYQAKHQAASEHLSEDLIYHALQEVLQQQHRSNIDILCHYPLSRLISRWEALDHEERTFAESPYSHVDFLIYNTIDKKPVFTLEVDGWQYHQGSEVQQSRDALKDRILTKLELPHHRLSTTYTVTTDSLGHLISMSL